MGHEDGWWTIYWHMLPPTCKVGDQVKCGDCIGYSNNSGASSGPHLHFGVYDFPRDMENGYEGAVDPLPYLKMDIQMQIISLLQALIKMFKGQQK